MLTGRVPPDLDPARLNPWDAAELLIAGCTHPALVARAAAETEAAAQTLIARPELARRAAGMDGGGRADPARRCAGRRTCWPPSPTIGGRRSGR